MKVAVIGQGSAGKRFLNDINIIDNKIETHSFSSSDKANYKNTKANFSYKSLKGIDFRIFDKIIIASPATYHLKHLKLIKNTNTQILMEKPICFSSKEIKDIEKLNLNKNLKIAYCFRFNAAAEIVKEEILKIGKIKNVISFASSFLPNWRDIPYKKSVSANKKLGGGVLLELSHEVDYLFWFFGDLKLLYSKVENTKTFDINVEDSVDVFLETEKNIKIFLHLDFMQKNANRFLTIFGERGKLSWNLLNDEVLIDEKKIYKKNYDNSNMHLEMTKNFILGKNYKKFTSPEEAFKVINLIDKIKSN